MRCESVCVDGRVLRLVGVVYYPSNKDEFIVLNFAICQMFGLLFQWSDDPTWGMLTKVFLLFLSFLVGFILNEDTKPVTCILSH